MEKRLLKVEETEDGALMVNVKLRNGEKVNLDLPTVLACWESGEIRAICVEPTPEELLCRERSI